jgi:hypothetical protein
MGDTPVKLVAKSRDRGNVIAIMVLGSLTCGPAILMVPPAEARFHKSVEKGVKDSVEGTKGAVEGVKDAVTHPGRSAECAKGDTKVVREISRRTVKYAKSKWKIGDLVTDQDTKRAESEMYEFFKWKLGNPTTVCGQYITAGYDHFNKAYGDEAAAALLGFNLPNERAGHSEFFLPAAVVDVYNQVEKKVAVPIMAKYIEAQFGIPAFISEMVLKRLADEEAKVLKRMGINIPKKYDFPNSLVQLTVDAKRDPQKAKLKMQRAINEAARKEGGGA